MHIEIQEINSDKDLIHFIRFPFQLYKNHKLWVPPLIKEDKQLFHPYLHGNATDGRAIFLLARREGKIVGRVVFIRLNSESSAGIGRFGWVEAIDELSVWKSLFSYGETWLRNNGATLLKGPMGFSNLDKTAMLVEGFEEMPTIVEYYNFPYYPKRLEQLGFEKAIDWVEFEFDVPDKVPEKLERMAHLVGDRYGVQTVQGGLKEKRKYALQIFELINETHRHIHGFVPFTSAKAQQYIDKYFSLMVDEFVSLVVDESDQLVGYGIALPSMSRAFRKVGGTLYPWRLRHLFHATHHIDRADLYLIGVADHMRNKGLIALLFCDIMGGFIKRGVKKVESNPELETNHQVQSMWKNYTHRQHKKRRLFQKSLGDVK